MRNRPNKSHRGAFHCRILRMKKVLKILGIVVVAAVVVMGGGILLAKNGIDNPIGDAAEQATYGAANAAVDATGIKKQIDTALRDNASEISRQTGLPQGVVDGMIDGLDVQSWKTVPLPSSATAEGTSNVSYGGYDAKITTYDDPSVVTISTDVGSVTLEVPESAQNYLQYLDYL